MIISASHEYLEQILTIERSSFSKPWTEYHFKSDLNNKISVNWIYFQNNPIAYLNILTVIKYVRVFINKKNTFIIQTF